MEQDSRSSESRERAISSEPSSLRPKPFDDDSDIARKRRRTSFTGSRSRSVDTLESQEETTTVAISNSIMKVDSPEPALPCTPPQADADALNEPLTTEPRSSKVTINLRNTGSHEATPASPGSPTPAARSNRDDIKASVEESDIDMGQAPAVEIVSSSASSVDSTDVPVISIDDNEEEELDLNNHESPISLIRGLANMDIHVLMCQFPYHSMDETYCDTVSRLVAYFSQREPPRVPLRHSFLTNSEPAQFDEVLVSMRSWLDKYLYWAQSESYAAHLDSFREDRGFWILLPDLFMGIYSRRATLVKNRETRDVAVQVFAQLAKLSAHFVALDCKTLESVLQDEESSDIELVSPSYLSILAHIPRTEETRGYSGYESVAEFVEMLLVFHQASGGPMTKLNQIAGLLAAVLTRFPKKIMDYLVGVCSLAESIVHDSQQRAYFQGLSESVNTRKTLALGLTLFKTVSDALAVVVDKSVNNLTGDTANQLISSLNKLLLYGLEGNSKYALQMIENHRSSHPEVSKRFTADAIANEWRFELLSRLMMSRQMQLRVVAVSSMSSDLVAQWKKNQEGNGDEQQVEYLCYLSAFLSGTGLIDYILGPTCHPEITLESSNIIGFLAVTKTYTHAQTDLFWHTVTTTQDPRVAQALSRMMTRTLSLMTPDNVAYLCEKLQSLPIDAFVPHIRELCDQVLKSMQNRAGIHGGALTVTPYKLMVRLVQESSIYGSQSCIAHPDIHTFALNRFKELLSYAARPDIRPELLSMCLKDVASKSTTSTGSLEALYMMMRPALHRELATLVEQHGFAHLLVDELENTIAIARSVCFAPVYSNSVGHARREFIIHTIMSHGNTLDSRHGLRLWDLLVGHGAACQEDRRFAWGNLNTACTRSPLRFDNPFLSACLREYLPNLPSEYYCEGALEFVRQALLPLANDANNLMLDDQGGVGNDAIELLWQMVLKAPNQGIESQAIHTLVNDIYVESQSIKSFPLHRARKVHFGLVNRCLRQLAAAAEKLKAFTDGTSSGDDEPMVIVPTDQQQKEEELKFIRSLSVLRTFLKTLQGKSHFTAPDLRSLMLQPPGAVEGESAELKFQSFDGDKQTDVKPLSIGRKNTAASLLASLREATGFDNYRMFYRGVALNPTEDQICKSLEELDIHNGLILVKRESDNASSPVKIKPGASPLEIEILSHFHELWEYLSMDEKLSREIYDFLVKLPADESILDAFENPQTSHQDMFPLGQPFKSLYAIHALREYLSTRRLKCQVMRGNTQDDETRQKTAVDQEEALLKALSLLVGAICDPEVVGHCSSATLEMLLSLHLVDNFVQLLKEAMNTESVGQFLTPTLQESLLAMLTTATSVPSSQQSFDLINRSLDALFECCAKSSPFWEHLRQQSALKKAMQTLVLSDERPYVRKNVVKLMTSKSFYNHSSSSVLALDFAELFWPMVFELLPRAVMEPYKCEDVFGLSSLLLKRLAESNSPALDLHTCLEVCGALLLAHTTVEDVSRPEKIDIISHGLISMLHYGIKQLVGRNVVTRFQPGFARKLFIKHLFPPEEGTGPLVPQVLLHTPSRTMLCDIIFSLAKEHPNQYVLLLKDLHHLTPYGLGPDDDIYKYELPQAFDRTKAIRSPCGYPGMKNLANTCYLNSLFTQLFMNVRFRRFMLETPIPNPETRQLLSETQVLFASLQDSLRRFVDPAPCVSQIMTYDETPIDTNIQMDVDEFFNLLFDRWEAQLLNENEKKTLRSIYGGQLVQQVKSKECEHISERMEPFSAIQCDVKGKQSLEASLQAYVDGEIMEGDNKYKCETCDRHVDAVKRACLKDVPDNLIFHLKRFDFNLRTLQRSKINDYFGFPSKIDMQPYTMEHLNDGSQKVEADIFELVGVLVHSGTAESGHYYSFIRERPTSGSNESWVEFNDDVVNSWDPNLMESACFGGADNRQPFDNNGLFEKSYSAYMLFYQRSSSLRKEQVVLEQSGRPSPLGVSLPTDIELQVRSENWVLVHRHCLNDPSHVPFVEKVLAETWNGQECSDDHKVENLAMRVALGHLDQVVSRAKDTPDFESFHRALFQICRRCSRCSFGFFDYFTDRPEALRMLLQKNADPIVRQEVGRLLIHTLGSIKKHYPDEYGVGDASNNWRSGLFAPPGQRANTINAAAYLFAMLWDSFHTSIRAWSDYFGTMAQFAALGRLEGAVLLEQDFLSKLVNIIKADPSLELPPQYARMVNTVARRMQNRPVSFEAIILLISLLMSIMETHWDAAVDCPETPYGRLQLALKGELLPYTANEINNLHQEWPPRGSGMSNIFVDKLVQLSQNERATNEILVRLMDLSPNMDERVYKTLRNSITGQMVTHFVSPYLRAAVLYVLESDSVQNVRRLLHHILDQTKNLQNTEGMAFFEFQRDVFDAPRKTDKSSVLVQAQSLQDISTWAPTLLGYMVPSVSEAVEQFLGEKLLHYNPSLDHADAQAIKAAGRRLAMACLGYLQETYVDNEQQAPRDLIIPLERVIKQCAIFFGTGQDEGDDAMGTRYRERANKVMEGLYQLVVDEIEEDGSDWDNSIGSSEQVESLTDLSMMQAGGEVNDGEIQ